MPNLLCDLPPEILINVLSHLPGIDLESCKLINRGARDIISGSPLLRYLIAVDLAGVEDNPRSNLSPSEKLAVLTNRELSWRRFEPDFIRSIIDVTHVTSGIYALANGVCVISALNHPWLHYLELPTLPSQDLAWSRIEADPQHWIVDIALAIYESDLIAIVTSSPDPDRDGVFRISLNFRSFKSGKTHPLARQPALIIGVAQERRPSVSTEIMGDFVALTVTHYDNDELQPNDEVVVLNWKTGASLMSVDTMHGTYPALMFLTGDILLVPNAMDATFEFWRIPSSADDVSSNLIYTLGLPPLASGMEISRITCRGEPNSLSCSPLSFDRPFRASPQHAIIILHIYIDSIFVGSRSILTLVVHRHSLVDLIHKRPPQTSLEAIRQPLPWTDWGPPLTRWFTGNDSSIQWITTSAGQRFASISSTRGPAPIIIYDFNPHKVAKMKHYLVRHPNRNMFWSEREEELEDVPTIFKGPVRSALPYCRTRTEQLYSYSSVLIDEETLVGIKDWFPGGIESVDIMHFG